MGSPLEPVLLRGAWVPCAATREQREAAPDPRPALAERYASRETYLAQVRDVLQKLVSQRLLSEQDLEPQLKQAGARWDWVMQQPAQ